MLAPSVRACIARVLSDIASRPVPSLRSRICRTSGHFESRSLTEAIKESSGAEKRLGSLKNDLHAQQHFVELIVAELRIGFSEIRPGMHVISHHFHIVSVNVVIQTRRDRVDAVIRKLARV